MSKNHYVAIFEPNRPEHCHFLKMLSKDFGSSRGFLCEIGRYWRSEHYLVVSMD